MRAQLPARRAAGVRAAAQQQQPGSRRRGRRGTASVTPLAPYEQPAQYVAEPWEHAEPFAPAPWPAADDTFMRQQQQAQQQEQQQQQQQQQQLDQLLHEDAEAEPEGLWLLDAVEADADEPWQPALEPAMQPQLAAQQQPQQQPAQFGAAPGDLQAVWEAGLAAALQLLPAYDVRTDVPRQPRLSSSAMALPHAGARPQPGLGANEVSLTAAAAAAAAASRARRSRRAQPLAGEQQPLLAGMEPALLPGGSSPLQANQNEQPPPLPQQQQQPAAVMPEDPRWLAVQRQHASYLAYMRQLASMVVSKQQQGQQLIYQVGLCESWLQVGHMLAVFGGDQLRPAVAAAMWKRLAGIVSRKVFVRMSHSERLAYDAFVNSLLQQSVACLAAAADAVRGGGSSSSSSSGSSSSSSSSSNSAEVRPSHLAAMAYGLAVLGVRSEALASALAAAAAPLLSQAAAQCEALPEPGPAAAGMEPGGEAVAGGCSSPAAPGGAAAASGPAEVCGWVPADLASLAWGLGCVGFSPGTAWLDDLATVSHALLSRCQPAQLWGLLWGFARLAHAPRAAWLGSWLSAARQQLDGFDAEGLAHASWALAALGHVPDKLWLRGFAGMVGFKAKSFTASQLALVLPALSALGYRPRPEVCRTLLAQVRRNLHTYRPSELVSVLAAVAAYPPEPGAPASMSGWQPGRLFLFEFVTHSSPPATMHAWDGLQAARVLWAFSRFRYLPDAPYLRALLAHLEAQLQAHEAGPDALSLALWGLAALRQPLPSSAWGQAWCSAALASLQQHAWSPQALAHGLSAMAALSLQPPAELMQALTRAASGCLASFSGMELGLIAAALADLHWRPSDAWMAAFVSALAAQLPACENEDYGLLLYGLASLAQPLEPRLLAALCSEAATKLSGLSGDGLGLLVWGLAQYAAAPPDADEWWPELFAAFSSKWDTASLRGVLLAAVALGQLGPAHAPPGDWECAWVARCRALLPARPTSWAGLVLALQAAAGLELGEQLPDSAWLRNLLAQLGAACGLAEPPEGVAAVLRSASGMQQASAQLCVPTSATAVLL